MSKEVLPIHGDQHCPGGPDPIPCLGDMPWARMEKTYASALQSIASSSNTNVTFTNWHNIDAGESGNGYFDAPDFATTKQDLGVLTRGIYLVKIAVFWAVTNVGAFKYGISKNVGDIVWHYGDTTLLTTTEFYATELMHLEGGEAFSLTLHQVSGTAKNLDAAFLHAVRLSDYTGTGWTLMSPDQA